MSPEVGSAASDREKSPARLSGSFVGFHASLRPARGTAPQPDRLRKPADESKRTRASRTVRHMERSLPLEIARQTSELGKQVSDRPPGTRLFVSPLRSESHGTDM